MTMVSKRILNKDLEERIFELFVRTISRLKNDEDVNNYISDLLSPTEKTMLSKRLAIAVLLTKGYTYETIDNILKVSSPTINKISFWLKHGKEGYQKVVKKILNDEKKEELMDKIDEILLQLSPPKAYGSIGFQKNQKRGKELIKRKLKRSLL